jgi:hypothetical protein
MPKNNVNDLITDQEMAFARLIHSGTMTDRHAAEAAGLNPDTAAYIKSKPRVRAYMLEHHAAVQQQLVEQDNEQRRRLTLSRDRVLARLWEIADLDPKQTRNGMSAQVKALSMIIAIEGLIPDRRAVAAPNKPASAPQTRHSMSLNGCVPSRTNSPWIPSRPPPRKKPPPQNHSPLLEGRMIRLLSPTRPQQNCHRPDRSEA